MCLLRNAWVSYFMGCVFRKTKFNVLIFPPFAPCIRVNCTCPSAMGPCPRRRWHLHLLTWSTLNNFLFLRGTSRTWAAGNLTTGCWAVRLQKWHPSLVFETSLIVRAAYARGARFVTIAVPNQFSYHTLGQLLPIRGQTHATLSYTHNTVILT